MQFFLVPSENDSLPITSLTEHASLTSKTEDYVIYQQIDLTRNRSTSHQQKLVSGAFRRYREATLTFIPRPSSCHFGLTVLTLNCLSYQSSHHPVKFSGSKIQFSQARNPSETQWP